MSSTRDTERSKGDRDRDRSYLESRHYKFSSGRRSRDRSRSRSRDRDESRSKRHRDSDRDRQCRREKTSTRRSRSRSCEAVKDRYRSRDSEHYGKRRSSSERLEAPDKAQHNSNIPDASGISIKLGPTPFPPKPSPSAIVNTPGVLPRIISAPIPRSSAVASVFNDDDDEEEEMPPEAKMKMKNVGRNTPTSAGPNSFGKTKIGFCNALHIAGREMEEKQLSHK